MKNCCLNSTDRYYFRIANFSNRFSKMYGLGNGDIPAGIIAYYISKYNGTFSESRLHARITFGSMKLFHGAESSNFPLNLPFSQGERNLYSTGAPCIQGTGRTLLRKSGARSFYGRFSIDRERKFIRHREIGLIVNPFRRQRRTGQ